MNYELTYESSVLMPPTAAGNSEKEKSVVNRIDQ